MTWIPCELELPNQLERCWFATIGGEVHLGHRAASGFFDYIEDEVIPDVTHWMLCKKPKHPVIY